MKILLTGAKGQLGKELINTSPRNFRLIKTNRNNLDLSDEKQCFKAVIDHKPDWVINCGAYTNVDKAEEEVDEAIKINAEAPRSFCKALKDYGGNFLQISTDFVFNGSQNYAYKENQKRDPICAYGKSKALGEEVVEDILFSSQQGVIIRTSWLISSTGNDFASKILKFNKEKKEIKVVGDQIGSPTSTMTLANLCWDVVIKNNRKKIKYPNILHCSDCGIASWYDLAYEITEIGHQLDLIQVPAKIISIPSSEYPTAAKRPLFSVLDCSLTKSFYGNEDLHWKKSLFNLITRLKRVDE